jgi:preprotein translocase SecE subunit
MANKEKEKKPNILQRLGKFFREVYGELKKVTWPTPKELISYTATVLAFIFLIAVMIGVLDFGFGKGFTALGTVDFGAANTPAVTATTTPAADATATPAPTAVDATGTPAATN